MQPRKGFGTILFLLLLAGVVVAIVYGYNRYNEKYYIALYDGEMVRYIDIPPFTRRVDPPVDDLKGKALLDIEVSPDQVNTFFGTMSSRRGFVFRTKEGQCEFEVSGGYVVKGTFKQNQLSLQWTPILTESLQQKFQKTFPGEPLPGASGTKTLKK
ncbi:MAG: hypothetical protein GX442_18835 [Candidatus Riflebacteria bacterium]|nr:hypothetical protein [Candidatus Riflebacteria bacterium]